jgi:hypothetical protein
MKMSRYKCSEAVTRLFPALPDLKLKKKSYYDDIKSMIQLSIKNFLRLDNVKSPVHYIRLRGGYFFCDLSADK